MNLDKQFRQAGTYFQQGHLAKSEKLLKKILKAAPGLAQANHLLGLIAGQRGEYDLASEFFMRAIKNNPHESLYHNNLGHALQGAGRLEEALSAYEQAIALKPEFAGAHSHRGAVLCDLDRLEEALSAYEQATVLNPDHAITHTNRGHVLYRLGRVDEALAAHDQAIRLNPDYANAHYNRGIVLSDLGHLDAAQEAYEKAISINPHDERVHKNYAMLLLLTGNYKKGWEEYEWRLKDKELIPPRRSFNLPPWDGAPLHGKSILLCAEQGIGDEIMFASCLHDIVNKSATVMVDCDSRLEPLLKRSFPFITTHGGSQRDSTDWIERLPEPPDYQLEIGGLPRYFRNDIRDFPGRDSYLSPDPALARKWGRRLDEIGDCRKVGISWRGGNTSEKIIQRSVPIELWKPIADCHDVELINLQYGDTKNEISHAERIFSGKIYSWDELDPLVDLEGFAGLIAGLDLVITIDNATAHMAGALGVPVWILLPFMPDWRWLLDRDDTPWYSSARLFRQPTRGDWKSVISKVSVALKE